MNEERKKFNKQQAVKISLITIIILCGALLVGWYYKTHMNTESEEKMKSAAKPEQKVEKNDDKEYSPIDFNTLSQQNPDIYAWIRVPNTKVDYAITQSTEDKGEDFYLDHGYSQEKYAVGTIYSQMRNKKDFSDPVTVLYGHNVRSNGKMFRTLHEFEKEDFFKSNPEYTVYTSDNRKLTYRIAYVLNYDDRLILDYYADFQNTELIDEFIKETSDIARKNGQIDESVKLTSSDKLLVLSTCNDVDDQRYLVVSKLAKDEKVEPYKE